MKAEMSRYDWSVCRFSAFTLYGSIITDFCPGPIFPYIRPVKAQRSVGSDRI